MTHPALRPAVADFSCALYLGLRHRSAELGHWDSLTHGRPAVLERDALSQHVAAQGAALQGCAAGLLWPSSLHALLDLLELLGRRHQLIACRNLYPITGWALERVMGQGHRVQFVDSGAAAIQAIQSCPAGVRPALLAPAHDSQGRPLPWTAELQALDRRQGWLVTDHTQLLGLYGHSQSPDEASAWGHGGGGWLTYSGHLHHPWGQRVLLVASWAKALGAPLASICGPQALLAELEAQAPTRVHCSPPSQVALRAASQALLLNARQGDWLRHHLRRHIRLLQRMLQPGRRHPVVHPMIRLPLRGAGQARALQAELEQLGVRCVAAPGPSPHQGALIWLARADHGRQDFERLGHALRRLGSNGPFWELAA